MVLFIGLNLRGVGEAGAIETDPVAIVFLGLLIVIAVFARPLLLRHVKT